MSTQLQRLPGEELEAFAKRAGNTLVSALAFYQANSPRTLQSTRRQMGPSDLGGCREFIRASIAGDEKAPLERIKWSALVGSAVGEQIERAWREVIPGTRTQVRVTATLPQSGIEVSGSLDAVLWGNLVVDVKSKNGTQDVRRSGGDFGNLVQLSTYLIALIEEGDVPEDAIGLLYYVDRSGADPDPYVVAIDARQARAYLVAADERLTEVAKAIASGYSRGYLRDQPESWCYAVQCPFYNACWEGYLPPKEEQIEQGAIAEAVETYISWRDTKKDAEAGMKVASDLLKEVGARGHVNGHVVQILTRSTKNGVTDYIDIRQDPKGIPATAAFTKQMVTDDDDPDPEGWDGHKDYPG